MIEEVARMSKDEKIIKISNILTAWNPLGERAAAMKDLEKAELDYYSSKIKTVLEK